ncbi:transcriptional regulator [Streptomyces hygroscopicus subsp. hygroscopicus]|nr:winged helix-turn-helix domain-containing protein [Streptomyces hygroscopicus]GLX47623.1 transcriptional regulator [Streptomyces hygroscopicus subsp. hygroscopicus]
MPLRMHLSTDDLTRVRTAQAPDPMWESLLSMHVLRSADAPAVYGRWRRATPVTLGAAARRILRLAPPTGYSPDFLTPAAGESGLESGVAALLATPRHRLRHDLTELARTGPPLPSWARALADGEREAVRQLSEGVRAYFRTALEPYWPHIGSRFEAERTAHGHTLAEQGVSGLLSTLHPLLVWESPVLTVHGPLGERDLHLDGRGVLLLPSYFCWGAPTVLRDPTLPPVVVYPMAHRTGTTLTPDTRGEPAGTSLEGLIGRTRAAILRNAVGGRTTTALARAAGVSPGTASHHASVLREAGLVTTRRKGPSVLHVATPLGQALLGGRSRHEARRG